MPFPDWLISCERQRCQLYSPGKKTGYRLCFWENRRTHEQRGEDDKAERKAEVSTEDPLELEDVDLVSLDGVKVIIHSQEDLIRNRQAETIMNMC